ncbi:hypothetical protein [Mesorhizobium sp.]|uniref:sacsin N-terminal ATP-binding-like domain-containing protein n=1 Tax=Mesorhizobium sp. TaxID=1871066 RepID=UPI000FE66325|nr:hypothetical protein [Mesorhizobium sp.]RWA68020.1 MAG: hypothetical protein EOQ29_21515 [Mesorhizobium sp.]
MPEFRVSPISIVNQIKSNLQDRYGSGYPILKELLQNADDSEAQHFYLNALPGWPGAANPLLRWPGLLVVNDGKFRPEDERGITSFGESSKATDNGAIGKFGFGQKAVFHLCDAFVVHAHRDAAPFSTVVNPFLAVDVDGNVSSEWEPPNGEGLAQADLRLLSDAVPSDVPERWLALWLPFRRYELQPAPGVGFSSNFPSASATIAALIKPADLRLVLTGLRNLTSIDIREQGSIRCSITVDTARGRLLGPVKWTNGIRSFGGEVRALPDREAAPFVGREATLSVERFALLQRDPHWPTTIDVRSPQPKPEKGEPHGAATLIRASRDGPAELRISWAVFLPVSDEADIRIPLGEGPLGQWRMLLHGYFFLDTGRREIEGLKIAAAPDHPVDAAALRRTWNAELRDSVVLPLVPALLRDTLESKIVTSVELRDLVRSLASSSWFQSHRRAICRENALCRVLAESGGMAWRLTSSEAIIRPLPRAVEDAPKRIDELFPAIYAWARAEDVLLAVDRSAVLAPQPVDWTPDNLGALFATLSLRAFQTGALALLLLDFLALVERSEAQLRALGPGLVSALRNAMSDTVPLASADQVRAILTYVPRGILFPLPAAVEHRQVLRALATAPTTILPVRAAWSDDHVPQLLVTDSDLKLLLEALEPHVGGDLADQAAPAALAFLMRASHDISRLARDPDFASIQVLRARDVRRSAIAPLSLQVLVAKSEAGLLFGASPEANRLLPLVAQALPDTDPLILEGKTAEFIREAGGGSLALQVANKSSVFALIDRSAQFGTDQSRARLLERLQPTDDDDRAALRRLCAGAHEAGDARADTWLLDGAPAGIERVVTSLLRQSASDFLVPSCIGVELRPRLRSYLGIRELDSGGLEALLAKNLQAFAQLEVTPPEREAFLLTNLPDALLRRLPIHVRSDGAVGDAHNAFVEGSWSIPASLRKHVLTVQLSPEPGVRARQQRILTAWTPASQIETALSLADPHRWCLEILDALDALGRRQERPEPDLAKALQERPWLVADGLPVAPRDVLALPLPVDEAARRLLIADGQRPPFFPSRQLAVDIREHAAFARLIEWILPDQPTSLDILALMIDDSKVIGRLGPVEAAQVGDFAIVAQTGVDLGLEGWPLVSAVLTSLRDQSEDIVKLLAAFAGLDPSGADVAGKHLDCLAALAQETGRAAEAARRIYLGAFDVIAKWPEAARRQVFRATRVPTESGVWREGQEVIQDGEGIEPAHLLAGEYASMLRRSDPAPPLSPGQAGPRDPSAVLPAQPDGIQTVDLPALEAEGAAQQRAFLEAWRGRVPSDLVIIYLGLVGRNDSFRDVAEEWRTDASADVETLWADLDAHFPKHVLYPNNLAEEIDQRRFVIERVAGRHVRATALSGDPFDAPVANESGGMIVGNLHKSPQGILGADGTIRSLITLPLRSMDLTGHGHREASGIFRRFVERIAFDCLLLGMTSQQAALHDILDKAVEIDQATLEETARLLRDQLPTILAELKLPTEHRAQAALRRYQQGAGRHAHLNGPPQELADLKTGLWKAIATPESRPELLAAVRQKIHEFGYSASRVLFELFQNADDAYLQLAAQAEAARFRVEVASHGAEGFRIIHWGRRINHLGLPPNEGRRLGHDRDLLNMLLMNFSEKRPGENLTGKFGLGFKSVHVLSDNVGIASGFIAVRTAGGFLPTPWPEGIDEAEAARHPDGRKATLIDVPFSAETSEAGKEAIRAFRPSMAWLTVFARSIRRIEILDDDLAFVNCVTSGFVGVNDIAVVSISGAREERALRFDVRDGFILLLRIEAAGPSHFPADLRRLWNLAPLEEELRSGWLLNGPFAVDPGRGRIAGAIADRQELFASLGRALGERLLRLFDLCQSDWLAFSQALDLDAPENPARTIFWTRLFEVLCFDLDDELARHLHAPTLGYGRLVAERPAVPTGLSWPFDGLVQASAVERFTDGALGDPAILERVRAWPALVALEGRIVASDIAGQLRKLGFGRPRAVTLSDLLHEEMGTDQRIEAVTAERLGEVLTSEGLEQEPLYQEHRPLLEVAREAKFLARDGSWRSVRELNSEAVGGDDELLLCAFAPDSARLDGRYRGSAVEFFKVARSQSGYGPHPALLHKWALSADQPGARKAVLRYIVAGRQGRAFADAMRGERPAWIPLPLERLLADPLLDGWPDEDRKRLLLELGGHHLFNVVPDYPGRQLDSADPEAVLSAIHDWWTEVADAERASYFGSVYPTFFAPSALHEGTDRAAWFTLFALACFQSFGRAQDGQHRRFIEQGWDQGWWRDLAESRPPDDVQSWLDRLERWSAPEEVDQTFLPWRRAFVDLYTVARWLEEYVEVIRALPRIVRERGPVLLNDVLRPSFSPVIMPLGLDAAPLSRSLGIGANWIIREMLRQGVYEAQDAGSMAPYCWAPSQRVRGLLNALGAGVGEWADKEESRAIHTFVVNHIGAERARFVGDFDLPLQLITREVHGAALTQCFQAADLEPPDFDTPREAFEEEPTFETSDP